MGIPESDQKHLFEPFYRASNVGSFEGTGLGLAIVKECAEAHGGSVACESVIAKGTLFTVRLPLKTCEQDH
jgi:signal transduction histidine kinase